MYATDRGAYDVALRNYMTGIYNYMLGGLLVSAAAAWFSGASGLLITLKTGGALFWIVGLSPLAIVFALSLGITSFRLSTLQILYWSFTILEGLGLSVILSRYTAGSITLAFLASAGGFAGCSLYGYTTKRDLGPIGAFLTFALFGLIIAMVIGMFLHSPVLDIVISLVGILLFAGLTAWDTQKLKDMFTPGDADGMARVSLIGALNLYLDFLNMFLFILRLVGVVKSDD